MIRLATMLVICLILTGCAGNVSPAVAEDYYIKITDWEKHQEYTAEMNNQLSKAITANKNLQGQYDAMAAEYQEVAGQLEDIDKLRAKNKELVTMNANAGQDLILARAKLDNCNARLDESLKSDSVIYLRYQELLGRLQDVKDRQDFTVSNNLTVAKRGNFYEMYDLLHPYLIYGYPEQ